MCGGRWASRVEQKLPDPLRCRAISIFLSGAAVWAPAAQVIGERGTYPSAAEAAEGRDARSFRPKWANRLRNNRRLEPFARPPTIIPDTAREAVGKSPIAAHRYVAYEAGAFLGAALGPAGGPATPQVRLRTTQMARRRSYSPTHIGPSYASRAIGAFCADAVRIAPRAMVGGIRNPAVRNLSTITIYLRPIWPGPQVRPLLGPSSGRAFGKVLRLTCRVYMSKRCVSAPRRSTAPAYPPTHEHQHDHP